MLNKININIANMSAPSLILLMLSVILCFSSLAFAQNRAIVRGKITRQNSPAARMQIRLAPNNTPTKPTTTFTGSDGMYYFRNIAPGTYLLEVLNTQGRSLTRRTIQVGQQSYVDVAPIAVS